MRGSCGSVWAGAWQGCDRDRSAPVHVWQSGASTPILRIVTSNVRNPTSNVQPHTHEEPAR
ncbi:hypothetical protein BHAP_2156 [Bifidobacterium hapali]|uniref:Uncharacterized protein n=1 Tax=Bifidobacterium hapali TaxID=1630172 RepID=A0A261FTL2_9BIFI|nr:hypothetical protein BHAP_2156 [Bifidobacterium hapali]